MEHHSQCPVGKEKCEDLLSRLVLPESIDKQQMIRITPKWQGNHSTNIFTGSRAELLSLYTHGLSGPLDPYNSSSDFDFLNPITVGPLHLKEIGNYANSCVVKKFSHIRDYRSNLFMFPSPSLKPGYFLVGCLSKNHLLHNIQHTGNEVCFCTHKSIPGFYIKPTSIGDLESVSHKYQDGGIDNVTCLPCHWPDSLKTIFTRANKGWPTIKTLTFLNKYGKLYLVKKGHPFSNSPNSEFRLSFSVPEVILARSLPNASRHTYLIARRLLSPDMCTLLDTDHIKTYYMKMTLFWLCHSSEMSQWSHEPHQIRRNVLLFFKCLKSVFRERKLRHFFISQLNLLEHWTVKECSSAVSAIEILLHTFCNYVCSAYVVYNAHLECLPIHPSARNQSLKFEAMRAFGKWCRTKPGQAKTDRELTTRHYFTLLLTEWSHDEQILLDAGRFYQKAGDLVRAYVLWLNALVVLDLKSHSQKQSICEFCTPMWSAFYWTYDAFLRQLCVIPRSSYAGFATSHTLTVYLLVTSAVFPTASRQFLIDKDFDLLNLKLPSTGQNQDIFSYSFHILGHLYYRNRRYRAAVDCFGTAQSLNGHPYFIIAKLWKAVIIWEWLKEFAYDNEQIVCKMQYTQQYLVKRICRGHVWDVCSAVTEYVRDFRPGYVSSRRHSIHRLETGDAYKKDINALHEILRSYQGDN